MARRRTLVYQTSKKVVFICECGQKHYFPLIPEPTLHLPLFIIASDQFANSYCKKCHRPLVQHKQVDDFAWANIPFLYTFQYKITATYFQLLRIDWYYDTSYKLKHKKNVLKFIKYNNTITLNNKRIDLHNVATRIKDFFTFTDIYILKNINHLFTFSHLVHKSLIDYPKIKSQYTQQTSLFLNVERQLNIPAIQKTFVVLCAAFLCPPLAQFIYLKNYDFLYDLLTNNKHVLSHHILLYSQHDPVSMLNRFFNVNLKYLTKTYNVQSLIISNNIFSSVRATKTHKENSFVFTPKNIHITKVMFKQTDTFSDLISIFRMYKFLDTHQINNLFTKYDKTFIFRFFDLIYHKDVMQYTEIIHLMNIVLDYVKNRSAAEAFVINQKKVDINNVPLNYKYITQFDMNYYDDCIFLLHYINQEALTKDFYHIKTFGQLIEFHDKLVNTFNLYKNNENSEKFQKFTQKFTYLEENFNYDSALKIEIIKNPQDLLQEGVDMRHSVGSYSKRIIQETYLVLKVYYKTALEEDRYTMGLIYDKKSGLRFHQLKGFSNKLAPPHIRTKIKQYLQRKNIIFEKEPDII